ncbi:MAG: M48 family metallopeptidase [Candidatus Bilamarchaeaceae archaeon]
MEKVSFFDAIEQNKRNSLLLIFAVVLIFLILIYIISEVLDYGICGYVFGFIILIIYILGAYYAGDKVILALSGAKELKHQDNPYIYNVVEGLAMAAGIPTPKIYIINDPFPNAFATGRDPQHSAIAVTTGLLDSMKKEELAGVLAHEISHIANYDIRFMMLTVALVGAIGLISEIFLRTFFWGGRRDNKKGSGFLLILGLIFMIIAPLIAFFIRMAISREREYLADANAAKLTRYPEGLARALEKIKSYPYKMQAANETTASLFIADPFKKAAGLFSTHPPIDERITRLRKM